MAWKEARRASKDEHVAGDRRKGHGAVSNATGRFEPERREYFDDGWDSLEDLEPFKTEVHEEVAKTIIATNDSPDIAFDRSINPYRGCEHGCIYCYARPSHAYWGYSAGLDFETKLTAKVNAVEALERELSKPGYQPATIMIGSNTDGYQPIERERKITRGILEVLDRFSHPVAIVTKSALVLRDIDILARLASRGLTRVAISVTTLDHRLARKMEPRASTPAKRIEAIRQLSAAGVPVAVMAAPLIPALNDSELERILQTAAAAGATEAA
jgi:DNA repair photolyase